MLLDIDIHDERVKFVEAKPAGWAGELPVKDVFAALEAAGIPPQLWPAVPSDNRCLERAMHDLRSDRNLIRPLPKGRGWALVIEDAEALDLNRLDAGEEDQAREAYDAACAKVDAEHAARVARIAAAAGRIAKQTELSRQDSLNYVYRWARGEVCDVRTKYYRDWTDEDFVELERMCERPGYAIPAPVHAPFVYEGGTVQRTNAHKVEITAKVERAEDDGHLSTLNITPEDHPAVPLIREQFAHHRGTSDENPGVFKCSQDLSVWFSQVIIPWVRGTSTRSRGGSYYVIRGLNLNRLESVAKALEACSTYSMTPIKLPSGHIIHRTKTLKGGRIILKPELGTAAAIEVLLDGVCNESDKLCDNAHDALTKGKKGIRALETQDTRLEKHLDKLKELEDLLGDALSDMTDRVNETKAATGMMKLKLEAEKDKAAA
ncbi:MAG: hypothetical protein GTO63_21450 [Anaerolineae bacterium]|nr:hypothetical protein [Anaerolineae bacterium]NIQ80272.1 hypothetical protein [Anaerolineae bacterium]